VSLKDAAFQKDDRNFFREVTYESAWDASRIYGCKCDVGYTGYDCSLRQCPSGDDPLTTGQVDEIQVVDCTCSDTCSGNIYISFRGEITDSISFNANEAAVKASLEELSTIRTVSVAFTGGTALCDSDGVSTAITFTHDPGDVPTIRVSKNDLSTSGATVSVEIVHSGQTSGQGVVTQTGTKEYIACNGRGKCSHTTGICECDVGFESSDRAGSSGDSGDCGYESVPATDCPGVTACSGHGTCSGATDYTCGCYDGYTGYDCNSRICPKGSAWFAEPGESLPGLVSVTNGATTVTTANDLRSFINRGDTIVIKGESMTVSTDTGDTFDATTLPLSSTYPGVSVSYAEAYGRPEKAHHLTECSNMGICDTVVGTCTCANGFTGSACQYNKCDNDCSGTGVCVSNSQFALYTLDNGDATSFTYGEDPSNLETWDARMLHGCKCDKSLLYDFGSYDFFGHDCSQISCPTGDDPSTSGVHEVQTITCDATGGSFTITFRRQTTASIANDATVDEVESSLEDLSTIGDIGVIFSSGSAACDAGGIGIAITFTTELGDLPMMTTDESLLSGGASTASVAETTKGTMENVECSNHGLCSRATGACSCFSGYVSSDGSGKKGTRSDCGARDALFTSSS